MILDGLQTIFESQYSPHLDIVCVHGFGSNAESTWHHDDTGKSWIEDSEFLRYIKWPVRVHSFGYNGDVAANMAPASIAIHANDLLSCLIQVVRSKEPMPLFFIAHGMGGMIVKKAIQICDRVPRFQFMTKAIAGVVFLGTPHTEVSVILLRSIRRTVETLKSKDDDVPDEDVRQFCTLVSRLNAAYVNMKASLPRMVSFWDEMNGGELAVVPKECQNDQMTGQDSSMQCFHSELAAFPDPFDERYRLFLKDFTALVEDAVNEPHMSHFKAQEPGLTPAPRFIPSRNQPSPRPVPAPVPAPGPRSPKQAKSGGPPVPLPNLINFEEERFRYWTKRQRYEEEKEKYERFLHSLEGWSQDNFGGHIRVAPNTCTWFPDNVLFSHWVTMANIDTTFLLGEPGSGKSHLAKAIHDFIPTRCPNDAVIGFFHGSNRTKPAIWEFLTWSLIKRYPTFFDHVPQRFQATLGYDKGTGLDNDDTPPLDHGAFSEIWSAFKKATPGGTIFVIVDGLEQYGDEVFTDFFRAVEQLRVTRSNEMPPSPGVKPKTPNAQPTQLKFLFVVRPTTAANAAAMQLTRQVLTAAQVKKDIATFVKTRLDTYRTPLHFPLGLEPLLALEREILDNANDYWVYAKHAIEEIEATVPLLETSQISFKHRMPLGLENWCQENILPILQSVDDKEYLRLSLMMIADNSSKIPISGHSLEDLLQGVYGTQAMRHVNICKELRSHFGDFLIVREGGGVFFCHPTIERYVCRFVDPQKHCALKAKVCLKYLAQDAFADMPTFWTYDRVAMGKWADINHSAYGFAVAQCGDQIRGSGDECEGLLPLLERFLSPDCPQYRTYIRWIDIMLRQSSPADIPPNGLYGDPEIFFLLRHGCMNVLRYVESPKQGSTTWLLARKSPLEQYLSSLRCKVEGAIGGPGDPFSDPIVFVALTSMDLETLRYVLSWGADVNARAEFGRTPLMKVSHRYNVKDSEPEATVPFLLELLQHGADPNMSDYDGVTALHFACSEGSLEIAKVLIAHGALANVVDMNGCTPLYQAYLYNNVELVAELISGGADVNLWWPSGVLPLFYCLSDDNMAMFEVMLPTADMKAVSASGSTPLLSASQMKGRQSYIEMLVSRPGVDLDLDYFENDVLPLYRRGPVSAIHFAVTVSNDVSVTRALLEAGVSFGTRPKLMCTPLITAIRAGDKNMIRLLFSHNAPLNVYSGEKRVATPLTAAIVAGDIRLVEKLIDIGADPTIQEAFGVEGAIHCALDIASEPLCMGILQELLESPIPPDVNYLPAHGRHALVKAIQLGQELAVRLLLFHGADTSRWLEPVPGRGPLHEAADLGYLGICLALLEREPLLLNSQFEHGCLCDTPIYVASSGGHTPVVRMLLDHGARADLLSYHYLESPLYGCSDRGNPELLRLVLGAAPDMINVPRFDGCTPLIRACDCDEDNLEIIQLLLESGADMRQMTSSGQSCISNGAFTDHKGLRTRKILEALRQFDLDFDEVHTSEGYTVLGTAVREGHVRTVQWLLDQGADPLRCQRGPGRSEMWRNAIQVCMVAGKEKVLDVLLEPSRGLLEHLDHRDWLGSAALTFPHSPQLVARIFWASEGRETEGGIDLFTDMARRPIILGYSPVDIAHWGLGITKEAALQVDEWLVDLISRVLEDDISPQAANDALGEISHTLMIRGGYETTAISLMSLAISETEVLWDYEAKDFRRQAEAYVLCEGCSGTIENTCRVCKKCLIYQCVGCKREPLQKAGQRCRHDWVDVPLKMDQSAQSSEIRRMLTSLREDLMKTPYTHDLSGRAGEVQSKSESPDQELQVSLQIATLHAFNLVAIHRPLGTPYMPLPAAVEEFISPFAPMIHARRQRIERELLDFECCPERLAHEMAYMQQGLRMRLQDEALWLRDEILLGVRNVMHIPDDEKHVVTIQGDNNGSRTDGSDTSDGTDA